MQNHRETPQRNTVKGLKVFQNNPIPEDSLPNWIKTTTLKNCWSNLNIHGDPVGCQRHTALMKTFSLIDLCFLSSHSSELFVFRYLEQTKAILYCSRSSLNCDLSMITAVRNVRWTFTGFLNSCNNFGFVEQYLSCSSHNDLKCVTYLFSVTMFVHLTFCS